jgi:flagellin
MSNTLFNITSMMHESKIRMHNRDLSRSLERLSTGSRINQAKDDPFRNYEIKNVDSDIGRIGKAKQNTTDGASLLQIADGTCNEIQSILQRVKELSVQSANDTLSSTERHYLDQEANELLKEVDRIAMSSMFNFKQIFGNYTNDSFSGEQRDLKDWKPFTFVDKDGNATRPGVLHIGYSTGKMDEVKLSIPEISARTLGLDTSIHTYVLGTDIHTYAFSLATQRGATRAIDDVDFALSSVLTVRTYMGAIISRLDIHAEDLRDKDVSLNDYSGKSADVDFAKESTEMAAAQIKLQSAMSILAQGNARVGKILEMLGH